MMREEREHLRALWNHVMLRDETRALWERLRAKDLLPMSTAEFDFHRLTLLGLLAIPALLDRIDQLEAPGNERPEEPAR